MTGAIEVRPPESFSTRRLLCRIPLLADVAVIFRSYTQDPEVTRYVSWLPHISADETRAFIERCLRGWETNGPFAYCISQLGWTDPIGMIQMKVDGHQVNFGYVLARQHWGKGLMPEALTYLVDWALNQPTIFRAWAHCDVENLASARVLEKSGMTKEGILRRFGMRPSISQEPRDSIVYAKVRAPNIKRSRAHLQ
jgi:[ribosomal protein S5]-alanine N-acetyltransferase